MTYSSLSFHSQYTRCQRRVSLSKIGTEKSVLNNTAAALLACAENSWHCKNRSYTYLQTLCIAPTHNFRIYVLTMVSLTYPRTCSGISTLWYSVFEY